MLEAAGLGRVGDAHGGFAGLPQRAVHRVQPLFRLVQIPRSHEVMFTAPQRLAGAIVEAGRD